MSIDRGGNYHGYIGDICRMAIQGEPDAELNDLWPRSSRSSGWDSRRCGPAPWAANFMPPREPLVKSRRHHNDLEFLAHGMGMVSHEAPRLTDRGPVPIRRPMPIFRSKSVR